MRRVDFPVAALGAYHTREACCDCGARHDLVEVVHVLTHAKALVCRDVISCLRRSQRDRSRELLGLGLRRAA